MGAKFTPGPWHIQKRYSNGCEVGPWVMDERKPSGIRHIIAEVAGAPYLCDDRGENTYANARLIAAAPELAAVAKRYEAWEARLILCDEAWSGGVAPLPTLTEELWDELLEIQRDRNEALGKAGLRDGGKGGAA
jgi:hypothetical protein